MNKQLHKERTERIQETGGKLRGGTVGNVWEWGPKSAREDYLMELEDDEFDAVMEHHEDITRYEQEVKELKQALKMFDKGGYTDDQLEQLAQCETGRGEIGAADAKLIQMVRSLINK